MTLPEFIGCATLAFGPPLAMFLFTIAHDAIRVIIMIVAAFFWLTALLASSILWFVFVPLRDVVSFGLVFSVVFQELFRLLIYKVLRKTERGLQEVTDSPQVIENKHILAYVSGFGFGIMSGAFALVNVLADSIGPATMGLKSGTDLFFLTSAAQTLCMILLHTFWSVIFFDGCDNRRIGSISYVVISHLLVSCITLLNRWEMYLVTLSTSYVIMFGTALLAFKVAGGSAITFKRFIACK